MSFFTNFVLSIFLPPSVNSFALNPKKELVTTSYPATSSAVDSFFAGSGLIVILRLYFYDKGVSLESVNVISTWNVPTFYGIALIENVGFFQTTN